LVNSFFENSSRTFIIAEAGSNWKCGSYEDDLKRAKELITIASNAGADAVKFQTYKPDSTYVHDPGKSKYLSNLQINDDVYDLFEKFSMPYEMIPELAEFCKKKNILFMSTCFSVQDAKEVDQHVQFHKVASYEINHVRLLEFLSKTKKPIFISTGASTYEEIDFAVNLVKNNGNDQICLMQCTSKYPCPIEALNLSVIPQMGSKYGLPIGFSDHSTDPVFAPILAVGLGATAIEKHFTLDRSLPGPDHAFALIPNELELMIKSIRNVELAKGSGKKEILDVEQELRKFATRSIQATKDIKKGEILEEGLNFDVLRPGNRTRGIEARFLSAVNGKKAKKEIKKGEGITEYE